MLCKGLNGYRSAFITIKGLTWNQVATSNLLPFCVS